MTSAFNEADGDDYNDDDDETDQTDFILAVSYLNRVVACLTTLP